MTLIAAFVRCKHRVIRWDPKPFLAISRFLALKRLNGDERASPG
jgi:hypothetical protein